MLFQNIAISMVVWWKFSRWLYVYAWGISFVTKCVLQLCKTKFDNHYETPCSEKLISLAFQLSDQWLTVCLWHLSCSYTYIVRYKHFFFYLHSWQSEAKWKKVLWQVYHELWIISGIIVTRYKMFHVFFLFCFDFLSKKSLFSKIVISLDYCLITYSVCLIQGCKIWIIVVWIMAYRETVF